MSADKTERWSLHTSVAEHATNEVVKMTKIKEYKAILTFISFPSYGLLDVNALQAVGNILDSGAGLPHLWVHLCRWQEQPCQHLQELSWRVS